MHTVRYTVRHATRRALAATLATLVAFGLLWLHPGHGLAATLELSTTAKKTLQATADKASRDTATRIRALDGEFHSSQKEEQRLEASIKALRVANADAEAKLRRDIRDIDKAKIQQLEQQVAQAKARYKPLFESYTALNKQITAARQWKNKELSEMLRAQAGIMQIAVQAARQDIRKKEQTLADAKATKNRNMTNLRKALDGIKPPAAQIKTLKSAATAANKRKAPAWKSLNERIKKQDSVGIVASFSTLVGISGQIVEHKREIERLERRISQLLRDVNNRLPTN